MSKYATAMPLLSLENHVHVFEEAITSCMCTKLHALHPGCVLAMCTPSLRSALPPFLPTAEPRGTNQGSTPRAARSREKYHLPAGVFFLLCDSPMAFQPSPHLTCKISATTQSCTHPHPWSSMIFCSRALGPRDPQHSVSLESLQLF